MDYRGSVKRSLCLAALFAATGCGDAATHEREAAAAREDSRTVSMLHDADLSGARDTLAKYFASLDRGNRQEAANRWCTPAEERPVGDRLDGYRPYKTNNAAPLVQTHGPRAGMVSVSLQILGLDNANIVDGTAWLATIGDESAEGWCIASMGFQPQPQPWPGDGESADPGEEPPPPPMP